MIDLTTARDALLRSGYLLEGRVETILTRKGYYASANSAYPDRATGKSRELDVWGMRATKAGPGRFDYLFTEPVIECVNNPEPIALITRKPLIPSLHVQDIQASGIPLKFQDRKRNGAWQSFGEALRLERFHHYCKGRVATQYCSFQQKKQKPHEWMAWHDEQHFDAFRKVCSVVDHEISTHFSRWRFNSPEYANVILYYPVVVLQGQLLEVRATASGGVILYPRKHLMLRLSEYVDGAVHWFQVDVLQEHALSGYLTKIETESERIAALLRRRHKAVRLAISGIVRSARRTSKERLRTVMTIPPV